MEEVKGYYDDPVSLSQAEKYIEDSLVTTAREYVAIGYWLRRIRDDKLFLEEGYKNFEEYVRQKYRKDGGWASKCIKVNGQFSVDGNSPYLSEQYQGYSKYQLVELAYMTEEQRELVDAGTSIRDMKQLRKPDPEPESQAVKSEEGHQPELVTLQVEQVTAPQGAESEPQPEPEVLHFIAGDRTIDNAYGAIIAAVVRAYLDSEYAGPARECEVTAFGLVYKVLKRQDVTVFYTDAGQTVFDVENARLEEEYQYWHGTKAKSETAKPTPPEPEQDSCPPGITDCQRQEWGTAPTEQEAGKKECKACWAVWNRQHKALGAAAVEQDAADMQQKEVDAAETQQEPNEPEKQEPEQERENIDGIPVFSLENKMSAAGAYGWKYTQIVNKYLRELHRDESYTIANQILPMEFQVLGDTYKANYDGFYYVSFKEGERAIMFVELDRLKEEYAAMYPPKRTKPVDTYDKAMLQSMIKSEQEQLDRMGPGWIEKQPYVYTKHMMALEAYKMLFEAHEEENESSIIG